MRLGLAQPGADKLTIILDEIIAAREDATPCLKWQNSQLIRHRGRLLLLPLWPEIAEQITINYDATPLVTDYWSLVIDAPDTSNITIRLGDYSDSVKVNGQTKKLKALYKEKGLPVQLRGLMPRIYINDQLILIPTIWQADDCTVASYIFDFNRLGSASTHPHSLLSTLTSG
jgi:tRNA(Ile)-lysidine synthetase-like protein